MSTAAVVTTLLDRDSAYELYLANGRSYVRVHELTGMPIGTLKSWGALDRWADRADRDERLRSRLIRRQTEAAILGGLPQTLAEIDTMIADRDDQYEVVGGVAVCTHRATPAGVRARLLMWKAGLAGLVPEARAIDGDGVDEEDAIDPADIPDGELFAELKRQAQS